MPHPRPARLAALLAASLALAAIVPACTNAGDQDKKALQAGFASFSARQYNDAETAAGAYIKKFPTDPHVDEAFYLRGIARMARGDRDAAKADLAAALAKTQRRDLKYSANRALADLSFDARNFPQAAALYRQAIAEAGELQKQAPKNPVAVEPIVYERLGDSHRAAGDWDGAQPWIEKAISASTDPAAAARLQSKRFVRAFALQFGAYADITNARVQLATLARAGVAAIAANESRDGKTMWFIRSGAFRTWAEAEAARLKLAAKKLSPIIIP